MGIKKTTKSIEASYWWPGMAKEIEEYVRSCDLCQRNKPRNKAPAGLLTQRPLPEDTWEEVGTDFPDQFTHDAEGS